MNSISSAGSSLAGELVVLLIRMAVLFVLSLWLCNVTGPWIDKLINLIYKNVEKLEKWLKEKFKRK